MVPSLIGGSIPESLEDYKELEAKGQLRFTGCPSCGDSHVGRTHTQNGWKETQISGFCEDCFDELFEDEE